MGAKCKTCNQVMDAVIGCVVTKVNLVDDSGRDLAMTRVAYPADSGGRCHDCAAYPGALHHLGCDLEECPICGGQLFICGHLSETYGLTFAEL